MQHIVGFNIGVSPNGIEIDAIRGLNLNQEHVECILRTPFGHFLNFPYMYVDNQLLDDLCMAYLGNETFRIGGVAVRLTIENIAQILGVPNAQIEINQRMTR